jgi:hypothetical protein
MIDNLTKEIIKRILANVGALPGKHFGRVGLTDPTLKLDRTINIGYDDKSRAHSVYAGKLKLKDVDMRGLLVDLTVDEDAEYIFVFRVDELPVHSVRMVYDPDDYDNDCYVRIKRPNDTWFTPNMEMLARMLAEFESVVSHGVLWEDCKDISDLYQVAVKLINKE